MRTILRSPQTHRLGWLPPAVLAQGSAQRGDYYQQVRTARDGVAVQAREPDPIGTFEEIASENPAARPGVRRAPRLGKTRPLANVRSGSRAAVAPAVRGSACPRTPTNRIFNRSSLQCQLPTSGDLPTTAVEPLAIIEPG
jgi:hypothetical protein